MVGGCGDCLPHIEALDARSVTVLTGPSGETADSDQLLRVEVSRVVGTFRGSRLGSGVNDAAIATGAVVVRQMGNLWAAVHKMRRRIKGFE